MTETQEAQAFVPMTRQQRIMNTYNCSAEDAQRFIDLREDGHSTYEASVMAGLADPHE